MKVFVSTTRKKSGVTLIELSLAIGIGMVVSSLLMGLFNQQLAFLKLFKTQNFLTQEAPMISIHVNKLLSKADRFRLHATVGDALAGRNAMRADPARNDPPAQVIVMNYRQPDGAMRASILSFEIRGGVQGLYYYIVPLNGVPDGGSIQPQWMVTRQPRNVEFLVQEGVLRMRLTGPAEEQITYSGSLKSGEAINFNGNARQ